MKKEAAAKDKAAASQGTAEDPGRLAKLLFTRLVEVEPVAESELIQMADVRAQAVIAELRGPKGVAAERLAAKTFAALETSDPVTAELALEALR